MPEIETQTEESALASSYARRKKIENSKAFKENILKKEMMLMRKLILKEWYCPILQPYCPHTKESEAHVSLCVRNQHFDYFRAMQNKLTCICHMTADPVHIYPYNTPVRVLRINCFLCVTKTAYDFWGKHKRVIVSSLSTTTLPSELIHRICCYLICNDLF